MSQPLSTHSARPSFSSHTSASQYPPNTEEIINAYEADQERIVNVLSRKLEQLSQEKVDLENAMEAENEAHVLRLQRELAALRAQQLAQQSQTTSAEGSEPISPVDGLEGVAGSLGSAGLHGEGFNHGHGLAPGAEETGSAGGIERDENATPGPSMQAVVDALRRENEGLRTRLHETELDYIRLTRTLASYREELLSLRRQLNLPVDNLLSSPPISPLSLPLSPRSRAGSLGQHRGSWVHAASPLVSATAGGGGIGGAAASRRSPIPEDLSELEALSPPVHPLYPHSLARRPSHPSHYPASQSISTSTSSTSSSSANTSTTPSPYASLLSSVPQSAQSAFSPSSSPPFALSFGQGAAQGQGSTPWGLTYPSVPPPSLSSSLGSVSGSLPNSISSFPPGAYGPGSRRGSLSTAHPHPGMPGGGGGTGAAGEQRGRRVVETGSLRRAGSGSRGPGSRLRTALEEGAGTNGTGVNGTGSGPVEGQ